MKNHQRQPPGWLARYTKRSLWALLLISLSQPVLAKRLYDVELIVFKRNQNPANIEESWPTQVDTTSVSNAIPITSNSTLKNAGLTPLPRSQWQLTDAYNKLANHAGFTPMVHVAWRQDDSGRAALPLLRVSAGKDYSDRFNPDGTPITAQPASSTNTKSDSEQAWDEQALETTPPRQPLYELDGTLRVYVQHYLFVEADMVLREPIERRALVEDVVNMPLQTRDAQQGASSKADNVQIAGLEKVEKQYHIERFLQPYAFTHKRRMRSGETHYLDNPMMGMIIQVRKVQDQ
ncbi:peptidoglycan binding protein CsiV [Salinivibrio kushneri]|uniref:peptidoglycan binding protein CsiV n=1 Tax=Salinivibrio kushneri TaxID=1908198 RepID=UPI0022B3B36A|nr:peptidoglycan binding protein CsiV [Salinivibrio kushneri]WBA10661.1 peptidoglycan binding protein CsiV [Salinivibrio kushneri]